MSEALDLQAIARSMKDAQDRTLQLRPLTSTIPGFDVSTAYQVADLIHQARVAEGGVPVGRKIGFTNPAMWRRYGVDQPIWAHVYASTVVRLEGTSAECSLAAFAEPKIEPEIVFHFRDAPPSQGTLGEILESIDWVAHGFEIVQSHFPGWSFEAADTVADWALHAVLFVGPPRQVSELGTGLIERLETFTVELSRDDSPIEVGRGSNVLGSPLKAVEHLLRVLRHQPHAPPLEAQELVTTGTITEARSVRRGEMWQTELEGIDLPGLRLRFVA